MKILHLSDFHYKGNRKNIENQKHIVERICRDLEGSQKIDVIIFSGDLIYSGEASSHFNDAKQILLDKLLLQTGLDYRHLFICPGNHDINRTAVSLGITNYLDEKITDNEKLNEFLNTPDFKTSLKPSENFKKFKSDIYKSFITPKDNINDLYATFNREIDGINIGFMCINSAWRAVGNNDEGNLIFPLDIINEGLADLNSAEFRILIQHHPLSLFKGYNSYDLEDIIHNKFDIMMFGHSHKTESSINFINAESGIIKIGTSATLSEEHKSEIGYSLIDINFEDNEFSVVNRLLDERSDQFYSKEIGSHEIPSTEEKKKQNKFRKIIRNHFDLELKEAIQLLVSYDKKDEKHTFLDLCAAPVLKIKSSSEELQEDDLTPDFDWEQLIKFNEDYLVLGKDKCGKTILLKKIQLELLKNYANIRSIPFYIDLKEWKNSNKDFNLTNSFSRLFSLNKGDSNKLLNEENIVLLVDNFHIKVPIVFDAISSQINNNSKTRLILCSDENVFKTIEEYKIDGRILNKLYFHRLRRKHIKVLTKMIYDVPTNKLNAIVDRISDIFKRLSIPFNFWTVSLFLWVFKKDTNSSLQNDVDLINLYIEKLLEKDQLTLNQSSFSFNKYKKYLAHLAHFLLTTCRKSGYSADFLEIISFTDKYLEKNPRANISSREIFEYIERLGVLKKRTNDTYTLRLNGVFEYFIAVYMTYDEEFLKSIINNDNFYLAFSHEFELYAGFKRDDEEFLKEIYKKTQLIFEPIKKSYNYTRSLDSILKSKVHEITEFKNSIEKITSKLQDGLTEEEQDEIEEQINRTKGILGEGDSDVQLKQIHEINDTVETLEKCMFILGRVYRNADEINSKKLVYEIFDYVIEQMCNWGFKIIDTYKELDFKPFIAQGFGKEIEDLLKLITHLIPNLIQVRISEMIGHQSMERILIDKLNIEEKSQDNRDELKIFIYTFLLCDIDLHKYNHLINSIITRKLKMSILKYASILKLNYYQGFRVDKEEKELIQQIKNSIQKLRLSMNSSTDLGELHKSFAEKDKKRTIRK